MKKNSESHEQPKKMNPWLKIWTEPRKVVRYAIDSHWMSFAIILVILAGINTGWNEAVNNAVDSDYRAILAPLFDNIIWMIFLGIVMALITWYIGAAIVRLVGSWFGGVGTFKELLITVGITNIPAILLLGLNLITYLIIGNKLFYGGPVNGAQSLWLLVSGVIAFVIAIWSIFILLQGIGEAHRFSAWRALATVVIPVIIIILVLFGFTMAIIALF